MQSPTKVLCHTYQAVLFTIVGFCPLWKQNSSWQTREDSGLIYISQCCHESQWSKNITSSHCASLTCCPLNNFSVINLTMGNPLARFKHSVLLQNFFVQSFTITWKKSCVSLHRHFIGGTSEDSDTEKHLLSGLFLIVNSQWGQTKSRKINMATLVREQNHISFRLHPLVNSTHQKNSYNSS